MSSRQLCTDPRTSQNFLEPKGSLSCSQNPPPISGLSQISLFHTARLYLSKTHLNIVTCLVECRRR
jgi:hypothetical protein